jgi:hypothetical protein
MAIVTIPHTSLASNMPVGYNAMQVHDASLWDKGDYIMILRLLNGDFFGEIFEITSILSSNVLALDARCRQDYMILENHILVYYNLEEAFNPISRQIIKDYFTTPVIWLN